MGDPSIQNTPHYDKSEKTYLLESGHKQLYTNLSCLDTIHCANTRTVCWCKRTNSPYWLVPSAFLVWSAARPRSNCRCVCVGHRPAWWGVGRPAIRRWGRPDSGTGTAEGECGSQLAPTGGDIQDKHCWLTFIVFCLRGYPKPIVFIFVLFFPLNGWQISLDPYGQFNDAYHVVIFYTSQLVWTLINYCRLNQCLSNYF